MLFGEVLWAITCLLQQPDSCCAGTIAWTPPPIEMLSAVQMLVRKYQGVRTCMYTSGQKDTTVFCVQPMPQPQHWRLRTPTRRRLQGCCRRSADRMQPFVSPWLGGQWPSGKGWPSPKACCSGCGRRKRERRPWYARALSHWTLDATLVMVHACKQHPLVNVSVPCPDVQATQQQHQPA